jgi:hypothetical protein
MFYLGPADLAHHDGHHVKPKGAVLYVMGSEKITGGPKKFCPLGRCDGLFGQAKTFIGFGSYLDKNDCPIAIDHDQVDLAGLAGEVAGERFEAFTFEKFLSAFFAPSAKQFAVRQQFTPVPQHLHGQMTPG